MTIVLLLALAAGPLYGQVTEQAPPPTPVQEQPEVLTRGPVHEAFTVRVIPHGSRIRSLWKPCKFRGCDDPIGGRNSG
jgi:hypothetical protein